DRTEVTTGSVHCTQSVVDCSQRINCTFLGGDIYLGQVLAENRTTEGARLEAQGIQCIVAVLTTFHFNGTSRAQGNRGVGGIGYHVSTRQTCRTTVREVSFTHIAQTEVGSRSTTLGVHCQHDVATIGSCQGYAGAVVFSDNTSLT